MLKKVVLVYIIIHDEFTPLVMRQN